MFVHAPGGIAKTWFPNGADLVVAFPQYSISVNPLPEDLVQYEIYPVKHVPVPQPNRKQYVVRELPVFIDGEWHDRLILKDYTPEEIAERTAQEVQLIRIQRMRQLYETDWTQVPDNGLNDADREAWRVFRQGLRDLPSQPGYPWDITWPTPPVPLLNFIAIRAY